MIILWRTTRTPSPNMSGADLVIDGGMLKSPERSACRSHVGWVPAGDLDQLPVCQRNDRVRDPHGPIS
jgi:hypothetical protein